MKAVLSVLLVILWQGMAFSGSVYRAKRWSVHEPMVEAAPALSAADLEDVLASTPSIRYSDWAKFLKNTGRFLFQKLTALKDSDNMACFITDLDPDVVLTDFEKHMITTEKIPEIINSPMAAAIFLEKTGRYIAAMCRGMRIFWLTGQAPVLPVSGNPRPLPVSGNSRPLPVSGNSRPLPVHVNHPAQPVSVHLPTPPPVNIYRQQQSHPDKSARVPPPAAIFRQQLASRQTTQRPVMTPPPLALWKRHHEH